MYFYSTVTKNIGYVWRGETSGSATDYIIEQFWNSDGHKQNFKVAKRSEFVQIGIFFKKCLNRFWNAIYMD